MKHLFLLNKDFLKLPMELVYYGIVCGEAVKGIFFYLNTDICDAVNFFVVFVRVYKGYACACRKLVDADFRACQRQLIMKLSASLAF